MRGSRGVAIHNDNNCMSFMALIPPGGIVLCLQTVLLAVGVTKSFLKRFMYAWQKSIFLN